MARTKRVVRSETTAVRQGVPVLVTKGHIKHASQHAIKRLLFFLLFFKFKCD